MHDGKKNSNWIQKKALLLHEANESSFFYRWSRWLIPALIYCLGFLASNRPADQTGLPTCCERFAARSPFPEEAQTVVGRIGGWHLDAPRQGVLHGALSSAWKLEAAEYEDGRRFLLRLEGHIEAVRPFAIGWVQLARSKLLYSYLPPPIRLA